MNILKIINRACVRAKMPALQSVADSANAQSQEYLEYANQANEFIIDYWNWRALCKDWEVITTANQIKIPLPQDYDGFLINQIYDRTRNLWLKNSDDNVSLQNRAGKYMTDIPFWRVLGNDIVFDFPLAAGRQLLLAYKSKYSVLDENNTAKELFEKDSDTYLLSEQVLIAGILYEKSKSYNDSDLEQNKNAFLNLLDGHVEKDGPNRRINIFGNMYNRISPTEFQPYDGDL